MISDDIWRHSGALSAVLTEIAAINDLCFQLCLHRSPLEGAANLAPPQRYVSNAAVIKFISIVKNDNIS